MTDVVEKQPEPSPGGELLDEVRDSAKMGQHAAAEALRQFRHTVNEAVPDAMQPLRTKLVDAAIELADKLVAAQYQFNRNLIRTADRALSKSDHDEYLQWIADLRRPRCSAEHRGPAVSDNARCRMCSAFGSLPPDDAVRRTFG